MDDMADLGKILQGDSMADLFSDDFTPVESTLQQAKEINEAAARRYVLDQRPEWRDE